MNPSHPLRSLLTATLLLAAFAGTATAAPLQGDEDSSWLTDSGNFSYTYVQARYDFVDTDAFGEADSFTGRALLNVWNPVYVRGEYAFGDFRDFDVETNGYLAALGIHTSLDDHIDVFLEGGYVNEEAESGSVTTEADGPIVSLGLRGLSPERAVEGELRYTYFWLETDGGPSDDFGRFNFDLIWHATDHFGLVVGGAWEIRSGGNLPYQAYGAGLRLTL